MQLKDIHIARLSGADEPQPFVFSDDHIPRAISQRDLESLLVEAVQERDDFAKQVERLSTEHKQIVDIAETLPSACELQGARDPFVIARRLCEFAWWAVQGSTSAELQAVTAERDALARRAEELEAWVQRTANDDLLFRTGYHGRRVVLEARKVLDTREAAEAAEKETI